MIQHYFLPLLFLDLRLFPKELHANQRVCVKRVRVDVSPVLKHLVETKPLDDVRNETEIEVSEITIKQEMASDEEEETAAADEEELNEEVMIVENLLNNQCLIQMSFTFRIPITKMHTLTTVKIIWMKPLMRITILKDQHTNFS